MGGAERGGDMKTALNYGTVSTAIIASALISVLALGACDSGVPDNSGAALFKKKCGTCHSLTPGAHKVGPSLAGIIGRKAGSSDFANYKALKDADFTWDVEEIGAWIADPKAYIGKPTAMTVKVKKERDRQAIIAYIRAAEQQD